MKKLITLLLALCLCVGLCACKKEDTAQEKLPDDWNRIAEATATLNQYYACRTEEDFKAVLHSSFSASERKTIMESWLSYYENWNINATPEQYVSEQYVRKIKYIETYKGCDIFLVSDGYATNDGYRTPDEPVPAVIPSSMAVQPTMMPGHLVALTVESGRYVIANIPTNELLAFAERISICSCDLGAVVVPGDPCKGCSGTGRMTAQPDTDTKTESNGTCATCGGTGRLDNENYTENTADSDQSSLMLPWVPCPDCSDLNDTKISAINGMLAMPCLDCEGTGLENYTIGECPYCSGNGYTKIG